MSSADTGQRAFDQLRARVRSRSGTRPRSSYFVPKFLVDGCSFRELVDVGNPYQFFTGIFDQIVAAPSASGQATRVLSQNDLIYLSYIRTFAALNGRIGSALTQIAFLPFLRNRLGVTVFLSLPTGVIGKANRKGTRGSPFAVSNPFEIDPSLADPLLPELSALDQYQALVHACRILGMRAGSIVPMATLAIDCPQFAETPALGFWWEAKPGERLCATAGKTGPADPSTSPPAIDENAIRRFHEPPPPGLVTVVESDGQSFFVAHDGQHHITVANAFPDVLAGEAETYTWDDVAMVRYTSSLHPLPAGVRNEKQHDPEQPSWSIMPRLIAWRHRVLGEQVFMVDVNPSVPAGVLDRARKVACADGGPGAGSICFIGEELWNFDRPHNSVDAVTGPLIFCVSAHSHNPGVLARSLRHYLKLLSSRAGDTPFLAGTANHDTMPATPAFAPLLLACYAFLPGAIPLVFSGTEFHAQVITNKEFGFNTSAELLARREGLDYRKLALFSDQPLDWAGLPAADEHGRPVVGHAGLMAKLRAISRRLAMLGSRSLRLLDIPGDPACFGYSIWPEKACGEGLYFVANWNSHRPVQFAWNGGEANRLLEVNAPTAPRVAAPTDEIWLPPCSAVVAAGPQLAALLGQE